MERLIKYKEYKCKINFIFNIKSMGVIKRYIKSLQYEPQVNNMGHMGYMANAKIVFLIIITIVQHHTLSWILIHTILIKLKSIKLYI